MEQLAERRMAREEDAKDHYSGAYGHAINGGSLPPGHNHPPPDEEEYDEDEEEADDDYSQDYDEEDEEEVYTTFKRLSNKQGQADFDL